MQFIDKACKFLAKSTGVAVERRRYIPLKQNWGRDLSPSTHFSAENIVSLALDKLSVTKMILGRSTKCEHRIAHYLRHRWLQSVHFISCNDQKRQDAGSSKHLPAQAIGSFSNDDGDGNKNGKKKTIGLIRKTTTLHVHHTFLYISLPSLNDYVVKMPNFTIYGERKQATTNFPVSF